MKTQEHITRRELYIDGFQGLSLESLLGVLAALGTDLEELNTQMHKLEKNKVQIQTRHRKTALGVGISGRIVGDTEEKISREEARLRIEKAAISQDSRQRILNILDRLNDTSAPLLEEEVQVLYRTKDGEEESVLDLAAVVLAMEILGFSSIKMAPVSEGLAMTPQGAVPSPQIMAILEQSKLPVHFIPGKGEQLTPFAAAAAAEYFCREELLPDLLVEKAGFGVKENIDTEMPAQCVRGMILTAEAGEVKEENQDTVQVLETNVDDCSGEQLGYAIERLMEAGALDASCFPVYMKKHRPAYMLQVICKKEKQEALEDIIFRETTSIGLRRYEESRRILPRSFQEICLKDGHRIKIKVCTHHGQNFYYPEFDTVKKVCRKTGRPFRDVYDEASALAGGFYEDL